MPEMEQDRMGKNFGTGYFGIGYFGTRCKFYYRTGSLIPI